MGRSRRRRFLLTGGFGGQSLLPFSDTFARDDGDLGNGWTYSAGVWTIASGALTSNPTPGDELKANPGCETGDPPTGYTAANGATLSSVADERTGGAGSKSLNVLRGTNDNALTSAATVTAKRFYKLGVWWKQAVGSDGVGAQLGSLWWREVPATWTHRQATTYLNTTSYSTTYYVYGAASEVRFDDFSVRQFNTADLFCTKDFATPNVRVSINLTTLGENGTAGIVLCLDSASNPQSYILIQATPYNNVGFAPLIYVSKFVNGTAADIASLALNYTSGVKLSAEFAGGVLRIFRNDVQIGSDYAVTDAAIVSNTRHGLFNSDSGNVLDSASVVSAPIRALNGDTDSIFATVTAAANLWTGTAPLDWLGRPGMADMGTHWVAAYAVQESHTVVGTGGGYHLRFSDDDGATWTNADTYLDAEAVSGLPADGPSSYLIATPNGDVIFLAGSYIDTVYRSSDGGKTWTNAASGIPGPGLYVQAGYGCVWDGRIYVPCHKFASQPGNLRPWGMVVIVSDDDGETWAVLSEVDPTVDGNEFSVINTTGEGMIAVARDTDDAATYIYFSPDRGATWSARSAITDMGVVQMGRMRKFAGGIMLFGRQGAVLGGLIQTVVWYSPDDGAHWCRKFLADAVASSDGGYCDVLQRADGNYYLLAYGGTLNTASIRSAVFGVT